MCGIFALFGCELPVKEAEARVMRLKARGPESARLRNIKGVGHLGFTRLRIMDPKESADQPLCVNNVLLICNGEIYNYKELIDEYGLEPKTGSDCEVILHLYHKIGFEGMLSKIRGVFALVLFDPDAGIFAARDPIGVRSMYYGCVGAMGIAFASELKALDFCKVVDQVPPGAYWHNKMGFERYYKFFYPRGITEEEIAISTIRSTLTEATSLRMMSDRSIGALLSGGLDSSVIAALVQEMSDHKVNTYSIGLKGSPDIKFAKIMADHLESNHHEVLVTKEEMLEAIPDTVRQIESYCTTTVRASVGNFLLAKWIAKHSDDKVIFCGDMSDEVFGGYRGMELAPNDRQFYTENIKLVKRVHLYDLLRSDKSISGAGLEARVPFADAHFIDTVMSIHPNLKRFRSGQGKTILRKAFADMLPEEIRERPKEAFSDGVSATELSWHTIIQKHVQDKWTDEQLAAEIKKYKHCPPYDRESLWYRQIFEEAYPGRAITIPAFWRHPFTKTEDPSARELENYKS